jgi:hypothetical protein
MRITLCGALPETQVERPKGGLSSLQITEI